MIVRESECDCQNGVRDAIVGWRSSYLPSGLTDMLSIFFLVEARLYERVRLSRFAVADLYILVDDVEVVRPRDHRT